MGVEDAGTGARYRDNGTAAGSATTAKLRMMVIN